MPTRSFRTHDFTRGQSAPAGLRRLLRAAAALWGREAGMSRLDERSRYLAGATDHADFERRLRAWDAGVRQHASVVLQLP